MSYRKKHVRNKIYKIRPKKSIFKKIWFWLCLLFLSAVLTSAYFLLFYSGVQIKNIVISGNERIGTEDLKGVILDNAHTDLVDFLNLKIISGSIFLVNTDKLNKEIVKKFPSIEKIEISRQYFQTLNLNVKERQAIGAFCPSANSEQAIGQCFLIDGNGVIFEQLSINPSNVTIVRQTTDAEQAVIGTQVVAQNVISAIYKIQKNLKDNFQINLSEALVTSPVRLNIMTNENWQIYFDLSANADTNLQLTKLNLLLGGEISAENRKNLYYIDLRPKDRAIICDNKSCGG